MSLGVLDLLTGDDQQFAQGLVALGWYDYAPVLTDYCVRGKARAILNPELNAAGEVRNTDAWVYRLNIPNGKWQDAVAIVESHLKQDPQFAIVFCTLPGAQLILVPSNPDRAFGRAKSGLAIDCINLDTHRPSNFEAECIERLKAAPKKHFRARLQEMVNTERITKKFFDRFKKELESFQKLIGGITADADQLWYSSVTLNRLMFIYFLQRKGFLDGDRDYLSNRLKMVQERRGNDEFQSFYKVFLLRLFHEGLGSREREDGFDELLGRVPYLNGGLFDVHAIEDRYRDEVGHIAIDIPDTAFERTFAFFNDYEWCLDTRPSRTEHEINPDVLGYIFEKYINQKQMGAYYTKEDITEYISKNTIIPYLFDSAAKKHKAAFSGDDSVWQLLHKDPDRYIYDAVMKGVELDLPDNIAPGLDDVSQRDGWNTPAPDDYALPTEIWREVVARRKRCQEVRGKLDSGQVHSIDDLITLNLNICRFAQDVIDRTDDPDTIRAIWNTMAGRIPEIGTNASPIPSMTVLDPTCGSGAFLFAALNILEPLYEGCLERMQAFVLQADSAGDSRKYPDFRSILNRMNDKDKHPNREYFVLKSIILNNLYGVDLMEEAVEICKLRLFLKMASVVEPDESRENYGLEPLPDMDFNIRAGNTLVGYATEEDVRGATAEGKAKQFTMLSDGLVGEQAALFTNLDDSPAFKRIKDRLADVDSAYDQFRRQQILYGGDVTHEDKAALSSRLDALNKDLNHYLARQYDIDPDRKSSRYDAWLKSHQPFHWFVAFYGIMKRGGFDVIIGNPPYVEYKNIKSDYTICGYETESCGDLYAFVMERSTNLQQRYGRLGMIVPISILSTDGFDDLRKRLYSCSQSSWCVSFAERPSKLFTGVEKRLTIWLMSSESVLPNRFVSKYWRWLSNERDALFSQLCYVSEDGCPRIVGSAIPKIATECEKTILSRMASHPQACMLFVPTGPQVIYYTRKLRYFVQFFDFIPSITDSNGRLVPPTELKEIRVAEPAHKSLLTTTLNSSLFFWFFCAHSDVRNVNRREIERFPCSLSDATDASLSRLNKLDSSLMEDFKTNARLLTGNYGQHGTLTIQSFQPRMSKPIIDDIDRVLAKHYGFTDEELDFIINYDIKYRMGINGGGDAEGEE